MFLHQKLMEQCSQPIVIAAMLRVIAKIAAGFAVIDVLGRFILL
jgi:hypothetical protein